MTSVQRLHQHPHLHQHHHLHPHIDIVIIYIYTMYIIYTLYIIQYPDLTCKYAICKTEEEDADDVVWRQENDTRRHDLKYHDVHNVHNFQS